MPTRAASLSICGCRQTPAADPTAMYTLLASPGSHGSAHRHPGPPRLLMGPNSYRSPAPLGLLPPSPCSYAPACCHPDSLSRASAATLAFGENLKQHEFMLIARTPTAARKPTVGLVPSCWLWPSPYVYLQLGLAVTQAPAAGPLQRNMCTPRTLPTTVACTGP